MNRKHVDYSFPIQRRVRDDFKDVPIIINSYNRLEYLKILIDCMNSRGYHNLYILDNLSNYGPLLDFYRKSDLRIFYLNENIGQKALWLTTVYELFKDDYYVYTDPDIIPDESCPNDFMLKFKHALDAYPNLQKVGFSLKIDDLPDCYFPKAEVISHESKFWEKKLDDDLYDAVVDTTFALYRPLAEGDWLLPGARTAPPYTARHLPWYNDSLKLSKEEKYYRKSLLKTHEVSHWSAHPKEYWGIDKWLFRAKNFLINCYWSWKKIIKKLLQKCRII